MVQECLKEITLTIVLNMLNAKPFWRCIVAIQWSEQKEKSVSN